MYEKRNNFREFTVNSVRQEIKNWIIIFLYIFGTSCPDEHTVGVCDRDSVHSTTVPDPAFADPAGALSGKGGANICFSNQGI